MAPPLSSPLTITTKARGATNATITTTIANNTAMGSSTPNRRNMKQRIFSSSSDDFYSVSSSCSVYQQTGSSSSELPIASDMDGSSSSRSYHDEKKRRSKNSMMMSGAYCCLGGRNWNGIFAGIRSPFLMTIVMFALFLVFGVLAFRGDHAGLDMERLVGENGPMTGDGTAASLPVFTIESDKVSNIHSLRVLVKPRPLIMHDPRAYLRNIEHIKTCTNGVHSVDEVFAKMDQFRSFDFAAEFYKFCVLYNSGGVYFDAVETVLVQHTLEDILISFGGRFSAYGIVDQDGNSMNSAMIAIEQPKNEILRRMIQFLMSASVKKLERNPNAISQKLYQFVREELSHSQIKWKLLEQKCQTNSDECRELHGMCCRIFDGEDDKESVLMLSNKGVRTRTPNLQYIPLPYFYEKDKANQTHRNTATVRGAGMVNSGELISSLPDTLRADIPFISTIRETINPPPPSDFGETPNMFDILLQNDCLPTSKECANCLRNKKGANCQSCGSHCQCFCESLCQIDIPDKYVSKTISISPPAFSVDPLRYIPRIIHQTWFEEVDRNKYKNMSRLIESWKQSGWDYRFYDDKSSVEFLQTHFPPEVIEAYDALIPGAFKADLFRYCVLLIYGGVYVDVDVILESNLDLVIDPDIGFMTAVDEPGKLSQTRMCLWNGFLAVAPGHPFMVKVIEQVVNNIRNRFTSVDMDATLCPNPELSVAHAFDTLFTTGPCIIGASINSVLGRHRQKQFDVGEYPVVSRNDKSVSTQWDGTEWDIPGRVIFLEQNKEDMGAHRFTFLGKNIVVAATDLPEFDDQPGKKKKHYSQTHVKYGVYGVDMLYQDQTRANEEIRFIVEK